MPVTRLQSLVHGTLFGRYLSVGVAGAVVESGVVFALTATAILHPIFAKAIGAEVSIVLMFLLNDAWTFADTGGTGVRAVAGRFLRSHVVRALGLLVGFAVFAGLTELTGVSVRVAGFELWPTLANLVGIVTGFVVNYVGEGLVTWDATELER